METLHSKNSKLRNDCFAGARWGAKQNRGVGVIKNVKELRLDLCVQKKNDEDEDRKAAEKSPKNLDDVPD